MTDFIVGTLIEIPVAFTDPTGTPTDPDTLVFLVQRYSPAGTLATYTYGTDSAVVRDSAGTYHLEYLVETSGEYIWRANATGAVQRAVEGAFTGSSYFDDSPVPVTEATYYLTELVSGDGSITISTPAPGVRDLRAVGGGGGGVSAVTASSPLASSGGATPNLTLTGTVPAANLPAATTSTQGAAILATPSSDVTAGHVVQASDARLSNARTPTAHTHNGDGSGTVPYSALSGAPALAGIGTSFTANGDAYYVVSAALTLDAANPKTAGTATFTFAKALAASPTSFSAITTSTSFAVGDIVRWTCAGISGAYAAVTLPRVG
jgi:hypothetical protein